MWGSILSVLAQLSFLVAIQAFDKDAGKQCCEYNGTLYENGAILPGICARIYCKFGKWSATEYLHDCCEECRVFGDDHIVTFDTKNSFEYYDLNVPCTYTLTERLHYDHIYTDPSVSEFGIYGIFEPCLNGECLMRIYIKENSNINLEISLENPLLVLVNNEHENIVKEEINFLSSIELTNILAWKVAPMCIRILSLNKLLVQVCEFEIRIWAHPSLSNKLGGLCGKFNFYNQDDLTSRDNIIYPLNYYPDQPNSQFISSWEAPWVYTVGACYTKRNGRSIISRSEICDEESYAKSCKELFGEITTATSSFGYIYEPTNHIKDLIIAVCIRDVCRNNYSDQLYSSLDLKNTKIHHYLIYDIWIKATTVAEKQSTAVNNNGTCGNI